MKKYFNPLLIILFLFGIISVLTIFGTSFIDSDVGDLYYKQVIWYVIGFLLVFIVIHYKNDFFLKISKYLYVVNNFLLLLLLFIGKPINNARCWFVIPGIGSVQPSEFMKIILILFLCDYLSKFKNKLSLKEEFILLFKSFMIVLIPSVLTFLEPDTGNVLIYLIIYISIIFVFGISYKWFILMFGSVFIVLLSIGLLYFNAQELFINIFGSSLFLRIDRLLDWKTGSGYQLEKSLIAIGSAGVIGNFKIPLYFPESYTDFIFASYASMTGYIGSLFLIILLFLFDFLIIKIAMHSTKTNKMIITGAISMLIYQQFQNIGMTFGVIPITGITLPFISYGGSSLLVFMFLIGIIINIDNKNKKVLNKHF